MRARIDDVIITTDGTRNLYRYRIFLGKHRNVHTNNNIVTIRGRFAAHQVG